MEQLTLNSALAMCGTLMEIPVDLIDSGPNDRKTFPAAYLEDLAANIKENGLAQPPTLRRKAGGRFEIVCGECRVRAMRDCLHMQTIRCFVRELTDEEASRIMLAENTARKNLNPIEEAQAFKARVDRFSWTNDQVADAAGVSPDMVKRRVSLLTLVLEVQQLVATGHFPIGHAESLVGLDVNRQRIALRVYSNSHKSMTLRSFSELVGGLLTEQNQEQLFNLEAFWVSKVVEDHEQQQAINVPTRADLPPVRQEGCKDTAGGVIARYIADLQTAGFAQEAATIGTLYAALVRYNFARKVSA